MAFIEFTHGHELEPFAVFVAFVVPLAAVFVIAGDVDSLHYSVLGAIRSEVKRTQQFSDLIYHFIKAF